MESQKFTYPYPRPMVTVDTVLFSGTGPSLKILLIQRKQNPFAGRWALPGGFVDMDETLETAVARELEEETGLRGIALRQLHTFGDPGRDPRGRTISVVYWGHVRETSAVAGADDAADARWWPVSDLPELAFDHAVIIEHALGEWKRADGT